MEVDLKPFLMKSLIVLGSFFAHMLSVGMSVSIGILYAELRDEFGTDQSDSSWSASIFNGCIGLVGIPLGIVTPRLGERWCAIAGAILLSVGMLCSMFATKMSTIYLTYGLVAGVGAGIIHYCGNTILALHFDNKWRPLMMSIGSTGAPTAALVLPPLMTLLIRKYDWRKTFLCLSGVCLIGVPSGIAFAPPKTRPVHADEQYVQDHRTLRHVLRSLSKNSNYLLLLIVSLLLASVTHGPATFLPDLMYEFNRTDSQIAASVMTLGIGNLIGRASLGLTAHKMPEKLVAIFGVSILIFGISCVGATFVRTFTLFMTVSFLTGFGSGGINGLLSAVTADIVVNTSDFRTGLGIIFSVGGIGFVTGMPIAGLVTDTFHTERGSFVFFGAVSVVTAVITFVIAMKHRCTCSNKGVYDVRSVNEEMKTNVTENRINEVFAERINFGENIHM